MNNKFTLSIVAVLGLLVGLVAGHSLWPQNIATASPAGSTFSNAKFAGITINLANQSANGTTSSIVNTDANDRYVTSFKIGCENVGTSGGNNAGAGYAALQFNIGTTSASAPVAFSSFAAIALNVKVSTSTTNVLVSSSTLLTATSSLATVWPSGTPMTFYSNATNTAVCTVGVEYFGS